MGDAGPQTPTPMEVLRVVAQGAEVKSVLPRGSQEVLGNLFELEEREDEEEEAAGKALRDTGTSDRGHFAQALEQGCLQRAMGPLAVSPEAFTREEEEECLLNGDLGLASSKVGTTPWNCLLSLYKQLQKLAMAKFPLREVLPHEEKDEEEEMEEEDSSFKLCVPDVVTFQSPLHKTSGSTDTVGGTRRPKMTTRARGPVCGWSGGFVESELKKLPVVQQDSRLWKMGGHEGQELLAQQEITLEEAGIVDSQEHQAEGEGSRLPAFGECWGPGAGVLRQWKHHPRPEGRVQSPIGVMSRTEHLLLEEMDEMGNWPPE